MSLKVRYYDNSLLHRDWWEDLNVEDKLPLTEETLKEYFFEQHLQFIKNLENGDKYIFIVHAGEDIFKTNRETNLNKWNEIWNKHYDAHANKICVIFVSGGDLNLREEDLPSNSHYLYKKELFGFNKKKILSEFEEVINKWVTSDNINFPTYTTTNYLNAFSILCIGYLAANGWKELPTQLENAVQNDKNKVKTNMKSWWADVLVCSHNIEMEISNDYIATKNLLDVIFMNNDEVNINYVEKAYLEIQQNISIKR